jgi:hypothetical protein
MLGYEREQVHGPWLPDTVARAILRRDMTTVPWHQVTLWLGMRLPIASEW